MTKTVNTSEVQGNVTLNTLKNQALVDQSREMRSKLSVYRAKEFTLELKGDLIKPPIRKDTNLKTLPFIPEIERGSLVNIEV